MDLWWYLIAKNNYMFRPIAAIFRLLQFCSKSIIYMPRHIYDTLWAKYKPRRIYIYIILFEQNTYFFSKIVITWRWPLFVETCSKCLLLNTIINPYYHSCVFMTDIYLTFKLLEAYACRPCWFYSVYQIQPSLCLTCSLLFLTYIWKNGWGFVNLSNLTPERVICPLGTDHSISA